MARESEQPQPGRHRRNMKSAASGSQVGLLEVLCYLAATVVVVGSVAGGWNFNLLIALMMLVVAYAILRDVRALSRLNTPSESAQSLERMVPLQRSSGEARSEQQPGRMPGQQDAGRREPHSSEPAIPLPRAKQEGTRYESNRINKT